MSTQTGLRIRRVVSRLSIRLLAFNVLLVFLPAAGISYLRIYEQKLLQSQERSMVQQARLLSATLSEQGALYPSQVNALLDRLQRRTTSRIRVLDAGGRLLADSSRLGPRSSDHSSDPLPSGAEARATDSVRESFLYRLGLVPYRVLEFLIGKPTPPSTTDDYQSDRTFDGVEVRLALEGQYGAATRISGGQRSVTLYSALPITYRDQVVGVVLVSQSTYQILQALYEVRLAIFRFLLIAAGIAGVVSLLVSTTISRPLKRLRAQAVDILDQRGRLTGRFSGSTRHDEIGDLARALSELSTRLDERMRFIESFAADVSHEFKNPLSSIRAAAEMIAEVEDPAERHRLAELAQRDIKRLERLLSGVREITLADGSADPDDEPAPEVGLGALLRGLAGLDRYRQARVPLLVDTPERELMSRVDGERISRAVSNLIDNALTFAPEGTRVSLSLEREGDQALIRVVDEGPGIPLDHRDRVFDRFFSYREGEDKTPEHSGLGLAIAKALVERHGGSLVLAPSSTGASFEIRLKARPAS